MELDNFHNILNGQFNAGFEIECCIRRDENPAFEKALKKLHKGIEFEYDGSLRPVGWSKENHNANTYANRAKLPHIKCDQAHEILTPVLPVNEAFQLLEKIFALVAEFGYTNESCGLHANFSPINKKNFHKINPFWLSTQPLWSKIRKAFGRENNKYCQDIVLRADIKKNPAIILKQEIVKEGLQPNGIFWDGYREEEVSINYKHVNAISLWRYMVQLQDFKRFGKKKLVKCHWHYAGINFENIKPHPTDDSRIEIRAFGNTNYHLRLFEIADFCDKAIALFEESYTKPIKI